jgi:hypothetical protein
VTTAEQERALRGLLRDKVHVRPNTLARLPTAVGATMRSPLDLGRRLLQPLRGCPVGMLNWWRLHPRGHAVIGPTEDGYRPGVQRVGRRSLDCVAWHAAGELLTGQALAVPLANLFDHLLGCNGDASGRWLSDGGGCDTALVEVGERLRRQHALGYAPVAADDPHGYFAWGLRSFLADRQQLNVVDPGLERLLATTLFNPAFWRRA